MKTQLLILTLALTASLGTLNAQDSNPRPSAPPAGGGGGRPGGPGGPGGQGGQGGPRMVNPVIEAIDLNKDGTIDADELAKAAESLKKLDKNGDGKITPEEYRPQRPGGQAGPGGQGGGRRGGGQGGGQGGPDGQGGQGRPQRPTEDK